MTPLPSYRSALLAAALFSLPLCAARADEPSWGEPMKQVRARFTGTPGTLATFGDSITVSMAFWAPLRGEPKKMPDDMAAAHALVKQHLRPECWAGWKGPKYGNNGQMTIRWAHDNIDRWLKEHNPEVAVIMFGTNDLGQLEWKEYEQKTAAVVDRCLKNGTVPILTTLPPRAPRGTPPFGPAHNPAVLTREHGWEVPELFMRGRGTLRMPFQPYGLEVLTRFTHGSDFPAPLSDLNDPKSPRVGKLTHPRLAMGKVTHPCGAPDNHLLTVWTPGSTPSANRGSIPYDDPVDAGLYLIKGGKPVMEPGAMRLIKNDPNYTAGLRFFLVGRICNPSGRFTKPSYRKNPSHLCISCLR